MSDTAGPLAGAVMNARGWDEKLRAIMLAGKRLRALSPDFQTELYLVPGCQSKVWLRQDPETRLYYGWSDAKVMRGVLALLIEYVEWPDAEKTAFSLRQYLSALNLERVLTDSRANGLNQVVNRLCTGIQS